MPKLPPRFPRHCLARAALLVAALMLAACPALQNTRTPPPPPASPAPAVPALPPIPPADPAPQVPAPAPPTAEEMAAAARDHLDGFVGSGAGRLGAPDYRRREGSVEVMQYRFDGCVIDFVIDGNTITAWNGRERVAGKKFDIAACVAAMQLRKGN